MSLLNQAPARVAAAGPAPNKSSPTVSTRIVHAGFVSRAAALVLDLLIVSAGSIIFAALVSLVLNFFGLTAQQLEQQDPTKNFLEFLQYLTVTAAGISVVLFVPGYFILFWVLVGATPGKQLLGLRIVSVHRPQVNGVQAVMRYIGYFISALFLFLGFFWVLVDSRRQAWHDKFAETFVIYVWDVPQDEQSEPL